MISNIQLLRGFAALFVVFYHTNFRIAYDYHTEGQAVSVFFVISGFIMTMISSRGCEEASATSFFYHRIIRIVPLYWFATSIYILLKRVALLDFSLEIPRLTGLFGHQPWGIPRWLFNSILPAEHLHVLKSYLFIPYFNLSNDTQPILLVGWTLNLEMYFYVIFSIALLINKRFAPLLTCAVICCMHEIGAQFPSSASMTLYSHNYVYYFIYGIAVYYAWRALEPWLCLERLRSIVCGTAFLGITAFLTIHLGPYRGVVIPSDYSFIYQLLPPMLVMSALILHSAKLRADSSIVLAFGGASYALYLTHTIVLEVLRRVGVKVHILNFSDTAFGCIFAILVCIVVSYAVHRFVELPSAKKLKAFVFSRNRTEAIAAEK